MMDKERLIKAAIWALAVMAISAFLVMRNGDVHNIPKILGGGLIIGVAEYIISGFENRRR